MQHNVQPPKPPLLPFAGSNYHVLLHFSVTVWSNFFQISHSSLILIWSSHLPEISFQFPLQVLPCACRVAISSTCSIIHLCSRFSVSNFRYYWFTKMFSLNLFNRFSDKPFKTMNKKRWTRWITWPRRMSKLLYTIFNVEPELIIFLVFPCQIIRHPQPLLRNRHYVSLFCELRKNCSYIVTYHILRSKDVQLFTL